MEIKKDSTTYYLIRSKNPNIIKSSEIPNNIFESIEEAQNYINGVDNKEVRDILWVDIECPIEVSTRERVI